MDKPMAGLLAAIALAAAVPHVANAADTRAPMAAPVIQDGKTVVNDVRYHYLLARGKGPTVVLLHGWGSTSYMWRHVMPRLVAQGYAVLAPDLRGFGDTDKPQTGYDKVTVSNDIRALVAALGLGPKVHVIGHDLGGMVAYAYAAQHQGEVRTLSILDVPLPGIEPWDTIAASDRTWHFKFFGKRDIAEKLISGREKEFFSWFHNSEAVNSSAFTNEVEETYARKYSVPGALRGGLEYFRAFPQDVQANTEFAKTLLTMPVLGVGGSGSFGPIIGDHLRHVATQVRVVQIENSGHWVAEEQPEAVIQALLDFLSRAR